MLIYVTDTNIAETFRHNANNSNNLSNIGSCGPDHLSRKYMICENGLHLKYIRDYQDMNFFIKKSLKIEAV